MKKVLELCVYIAILIAVIIHTLTGGGASRTAAPPPVPPESSLSLPDPEPRRGQPREGMV